MWERWRHGCTRNASTQTLLVGKAIDLGGGRISLKKRLVLCTPSDRPH